LITKPPPLNIVLPEFESHVQREFDFGDQDFERVRTLIHARAGIALSPTKREMVYSRLARRLRELRMTTFRKYLALLDDGGHPEWENFVNALTTNLTSFFRESHHFPMLADHLRERARSGEPIELWCAASSTGEEPYSMAITAIETFSSVSPPVRIHATDVDTQVLAYAERGIYPADRVEKLSPERMRRFFLRGTNDQEGSVRVRPELRALVRFSRLNLLDRQWPLKTRFDAIFCRNVMIYFDRQTQRGIVERFVPLMKPDGLLFAGHSESLHHCADLFRLKGRTVYELAGRRV
jgi:chemotaxis protein methyltransferase CheR